MLPRTLVMLSGAGYILGTVDFREDRLIQKKSIKMIRFSIRYMKDTGLHGFDKRVRINQNLISIIRIDTK